MNIYERKFKTASFIVLTICVLFFGGIIHKYFGAKTIQESETLEKYSRNSELEVAVYYPLSNLKSNASDFFVRWWENPAEENKCYLFLPLAVKEKTIHWFLQNDTNLWVDQIRIQDGDIFELQEGVYEVELERGGETSCKTMEVLYSSCLPSLFIETESGTLDYAHGQRGNTESGKYAILNAQGVLENGGIIDRFRGRGNVSWYETDKKSYLLDLQEKANLVSMGENKDWILYSNAFDKTLFRNKISFDLAKRMELPYTPDYEYIDVYINGEYRGNYLLMEKIEIDENRVAIRNLEKETEVMNGENLVSAERFLEQGKDGVSSLKGIKIENQPKDLTGGYLLELDFEGRYQEEISGFISTRRQPVNIKSPKYASYEQVSYIMNFYQEFEDAVFSEDGTNPVTGRKYTEFIDMYSFVRKYLLEEIIKNIDASSTSQYIYKPSDGESEKMYAGPAWDYDKAIGIGAISDAGVDLWIPEYIHAGSKKHESDIWWALYQQPEFKDMAVEVFRDEVCLMIEKELTQTVPETIEMIFPSAKMNIIRWHMKPGQQIEERMDWYLEDVQNRVDFLRNRADFLKDEWNIR